MDALDMKKSGREMELLYIFRRLYEKGKITKEEFEKCKKKVLEGNY